MEGESTGGQKSSCMSTTSSAGLKGVVEAIVAMAVWFLDFCLGALNVWKAYVSV